MIDELEFDPRVNLRYRRERDVRAQIRAAFERSADLEASGITVNVADGKVVWGGKVRSWIEREEAARAAWSAPGVVAVEDDIQITRP